MPECCEICGNKATLALLNDMAILGYEPTIRCALADAPDFPSDDKQLVISTNPTPLDEWCNYFIKFYDVIPEVFDNAPY